MRGAANAHGLGDTWGMRILHTSDWHIGRTLHGADLARSVDAFFAQLLEAVEERAVDLVLISGDLFDRAVPPVEAISQTNALLERLTGRARVIITSGNHDGPARLGLFAKLLSDRLVVVTDPETIGTAVECGDPDDGCLVYPIPYLEPDLVRHVLADPPSSESERPDPLPRSHEAVVSAALRRVRCDLVRRRGLGDARPAVLMVHAFLTGGTASDSERDIEVGGACAVPAAVFDALGGEEPVDLGVVYVAAGHLHRPQEIRGASMPIRFSGSPIAYSFSEAGADKSMVLIDTGSAPVTPELIALRAHRPVVRLQGFMDDLLASPDPQAPRAYCSISVLDAARPENMIARLREVYPHALVIRHLGSADPQSAPRAARSDREPSEVASEFFATVGGRALNDEEAAVLDGMWARIRIGRTK